MKEYSEKELIEFANYCIWRRQNTEDYIIDGGVTDADLENWKEGLLKSRRNTKIEKILKSIINNGRKEM